MPEEYIEKGETVKFGCKATAKIDHISKSLAIVKFIPGEDGGLNTTDTGICERLNSIEIGFYIDEIPEAIHLLQRIYKTGMRKRNE